MYKWISVNVELPPKSFDYFILMYDKKSDSIVPGWFDGQYFCFRNPNGDLTHHMQATHWLSLKDLESKFKEFK